MTALPTPAYLRRHALPAHFLAELGHMVERRDTPPARPKLVAAWRPGPDGRPVFGWTGAAKASPPSG